ncbi:MAG: DNA polymerase III subunit beta [Candidatus Omnitrophica bacterium]|nr:DNA polymerase III subunit beta [Candidatus Omnitrophota bacterium]
MKITVEKEVLIKGIETILNVISTKATLPILSNFLLETHKNSLKMTATDLNIGISCVIPVEVHEQGAITIPARRFSSIIKELPENTIHLTTKKNNIISIETQNCYFKIIGLAAEEFPKLPELKEKQEVIIEQGILKQMLEQTAFAVSIDETRYILNGILFTSKKDSLTLVATDGKRLAINTKKLIQPTEKDFSIIVPLKTIQELQRNIKNEDSELNIVIGSNQILFHLNGTTIISRLIEGEFPDYTQVIPPPTDNKMRIEREKFLLAIRRASLLSTPDYQAVKFEIFKNKLVLSKSTPDIGESREEIPIEYNGKEMIIGFNPNYLIDVLRNLNVEIIDFEITGSERPGVIRMSDYIYIVLPMRLG